MGRIYQNENQLLLRELIKIYEPNNFDWLSYQVTKSNILTLHHILKVCDGGDLSIENAALLTKKSHRALHMCESRDLILYMEINEFFKEIVRNAAPLNEYLIEESKNYKCALVKTLYK